MFQHDRDDDAERNVIGELWDSRQGSDVREPSPDDQEIENADRESGRRAGDQRPLSGHDQREDDSPERGQSEVNRDGCTYQLWAPVLA